MPMNATKFNTANPDSNNASGFTLIEVLVSMIVLAIGLLGLAGMQAASLKNNQSAFFRSQATQLAYDMADRMRVNREGLSNGNYNNQGAPNNPADCELNSCTPAQMAGYDLARWNTAIAGQLPGGSGWVCIDSTSDDGTPASPACDGNGEAYAVKIWWTDRREAEQEADRIVRFVMTFRP